MSKTCVDRPKYVLCARMYKPEYLIRGLLINFRTRHFSRFYDIKKAFDGTATDINDPIFIF